MFMLVCLADTWILTYSKLNSLTHPTPTPTTTPLVLLWHLYFHFHFQFPVALPIQLPKPETSEALSTLIWPLLPVPMPLRSLGPPWFPRPLSHTCLSLLFIIYFWGYFPKTNQVGHCFRASALQGWCQSPQLPGSGLHSLTLVCVLLLSDPFPSTLNLVRWTVLGPLTVPVPSSPSLANSFQTLCEVFPDLSNPFLKKIKKYI